MAKKDRTGGLVALFITGWVLSAILVLGFWGLVIWGIIEAIQWLQANS